MGHTQIDKLPSYIELDGEEGCFFLNLCKDVYGQWSAAYVLYQEPDDRDLTAFFINEAQDLDEVYVRMRAKLDRRKVKHG